MREVYIYERIYGTLCWDEVGIYIYERIYGTLCWDEVGIYMRGFMGL